jgi:hypothetical protein
MRRDHPLRTLFSELIHNALRGQLRYSDMEVATYLADLLASFVRADQLYKIRDASGRPLEDVGEMLLESNPLLGAASFDREREVRKHIGDYTLFFTGLFPEHLRRPRRSLRLDYFVDYVKAGKESYTIVSKFDQFEYRRMAPLFRRLAENFEICVYGLNCVRDELRQMENTQYRRAEKMLLS